MKKIRMLKTVGRRKKGNVYILSDWKASTYVRYREAEIIQDMGNFNSNGMRRQRRLTRARKKLWEMLKEFPELEKEICPKTDDAGVK